MTNMLNLIGKAESKGYEDAFGVPGRVPVTNMSVDEVLDFQGSMKASGSPSTAIGRYQFLNKTLKGIKKDLGLSGDEKMTPELQDRMAVHLMRRRGLDSYLRGEMDKNTFANRLAMEWAGLPTTSGHSYYYGDGLNKSNVPLEDFLQVVTGLASNPDLGLGGGEANDRLQAARLSIVEKGLLLGLRGAETLGVGGTKVKLYNDFVQRGRTNPVSEKDLSGEDIAGLREVIKTHLEYVKDNPDSFKGVKTNAIQLHNYQMAGRQDLHDLLGAFTFSEDKEGNVIVKDTYDYNKDTDENLATTLPQMVKQAYRDPEKLAAGVGYKAIPEGRGIPIKINLGRLNK